MTLLGRFLCDAQLDYATRTSIGTVNAVVHV